MHASTPRSHFKAADVEIITGISVDVQKDWQKKISAMSLPALGQGNGHRLYSYVDLFFFRLVDVLKTRGVPVSLALTGCLYRDDDMDSASGMRHPASLDIRDRLFTAFATHLLGFETNSDITLFVATSGPSVSDFTWFLSCLAEPGKPATGADPDITLESIFEIRPSADHVIAVNISALVRRMLDHIKQMEPLLDDLDAASLGLPVWKREG
ncbi:hypothetical protein G6L86_20150 [Agrobacterium tumefaciens]|uniref:hypothetical protein n=1 Tax=Agrobacterium tumefaciens TaxID=358 RepID=UPI001571B5C5|nr:hypothetical protein [Agrobacterium tumefaciens]NSX87924.1 hypothetical protein [Agrobacterium tumefaciens]